MGKRRRSCPSRPSVSRSIGIGKRSISRTASLPLVATHPEISGYEETTESQQVVAPDKDPTDFSSENDGQFSIPFEGDVTFREPGTLPSTQSNPQNTRFANDRTPWLYPIECDPNRFKRTKVKWKTNQKYVDYGDSLTS